MERNIINKLKYKKMKKINREDITDLDFIKIIKKKIITTMK